MASMPAATSAASHTTKRASANTDHVRHGSSIRLMSETHAQVTERAHALLGAQFEHAAQLLEQVQSILDAAGGHLKNGKYESAYQGTRQACTKLKSAIDLTAETARREAEEHQAWREVFATAYTQYQDDQAAYGGSS